MDASKPALAAPLPPVRLAWGGMSPTSAAILTMAATGVLDLCWASRLPLTFSGWSWPVLAILGLLGLSLFYRVLRPVPVLSELPAYAAHWIALSIVGGIGTYYASAAAMPLADPALAAFDALVGFDWVTWVQAVRSLPVLNWLLRAAYDSLMPQIIVTLALIACSGTQGRNAEFLLAAAVGLLLTVIISAWMPALGPWEHFGTGALNPSDTAYVPHVMAMRQGGQAAFDLAKLEGIVCFPSFHTVMALLLVHAHRGLRWSRLPFAALNLLMLLSIPSEGGHYLADMAAGALIAALTLAAVRAPWPGGQRA